MWLLLGVKITEPNPPLGRTYCRDILPRIFLEKKIIELSLGMINGHCCQSWGWNLRERKSVGQMIGRSERKWLVLSGQAIKRDGFRIAT